MAYNFLRNKSLSIFFCYAGKLLRGGKKEKNGKTEIKQKLSFNLLRLKSHPF